MIKNIKYSEYLKQFDYISKQINPTDLFKVDLIESDNKFLTFYNIPFRSVCAVRYNTFNTIEVLSLISVGDGNGSKLLNYITSIYYPRFKIVLNSFESNNKFYTKNGFKCYKVDLYNPTYDPYELNKNKENVNYYTYGGSI